MKNKVIILSLAILLTFLALPCKKAIAWELGRIG